MNATRDSRERRGANRPTEPGDGRRSTSFSEEDGVLVVRDLGLFRPGREEFCRRLVVAAGRFRVKSAQVSLASGTCRLEFEAGRADASEMAGRFAEAVRSAIDRVEAVGPPGHRDRGWISLMVFPAVEGESTWETTREGTGWLRLRHQDLHQDRALARRVAAELSDAPGIDLCRVTFLGRELEIRFDPGRFSPASALSAAEAAYRRAVRLAPARVHNQGEKTPAVATGPRRLWYLALAGGSFGLTVVGLVVPGIPTVPFLLATSYYLARSSPRLNRVLLRSRFFGPILADLEAAGGLRRINKIKLIGFTLVVACVTLAIAGPSVVIILVMVPAISASLYAIKRIPEIPAGSEPAQRAELMSATA